MSHHFEKPSFAEIHCDDDDDDDDDDFIINSPVNASLSTKLNSLSRITKSTGRCSTASKSSQVKNSKSHISSSFPSSKGWISSSFGGFEGLTSVKPVSLKKSKSSQSNLLSSVTVNAGESSKKNNSNEELWIDKYRPTTESELAVHKKKVEEVRTWLLENLCAKSNAILLLTGPVGAGKTATLHALSSELGFEIQEWINPSIPSLPEGLDFESQSYTPKFLTSQSQLVLFQEFLLRANKYPTLSIFGAQNEATKRKIVLVEDLPNIFFQEAKKLHEVLMSYRQTGRSPMVLIISDSHHEGSNVHRLLPKNIQQNLGMTTASFNPVAHTSLVKSLNRIVSLESKKAGKDFFLPTKDTISELCQSSAGDIRTAINALQFCCQKVTQDESKKRLSKYKSNGKRVRESTLQESKATKTKTKRTGSKKSASALLYDKEENQNENRTLAAIGGKDTSIFLFRALGKILYCKRELAHSDKDLLPRNMEHVARNIPQFCPEDVVERAHLSSEMLTLYLHQNYLDFFSDIEDVVLASEYLSDSNMMSVEWMHRSSLMPYMSCIATRGLVFSNIRRVGTTSVGGTTKGGWRPLHKPQWLDVNKKTRENRRIAKDIFPERTCPTAVLYTQILPYLAKTDVPLKTPSQISFIQQMSRYYNPSKLPFRSSSSTLDEKDCGSDIEEDDTTNPQPNSSVMANSQITNDSTKQIIIDDAEILREDDDIIEDFDDEW